MIIKILKQIYKHNTKFFLRKMTKGKLPDFVIIGAQKSGTKSICHYLNKHPEINILPKYHSVESKFFSHDKYFNKGINWYKSLFYQNSKLQGDNTPEYIFYLQAHERMKKYIPDAKLILTLRDPVYRAYSAYNHFKQTGRDASFYCPNDDFITNIYEEKKNNFEKGIICRGFYINQIEHLLQFYERKQLMIVTNEELKNNTNDTYKKIFNFLGLESIPIQFDKLVHSKKYFVEPLSDETKELLLKIYTPYNERLFNFLGYEIQDWLK